MKITLPSGLRSLKIAALVGALALLAGWGYAADAGIKTSDRPITASGLTTADRPVTGSGLTTTAITSANLSAYSVEDFMRDHRRYPLAKDEAEKILGVLNDSVAAHLMAIEFFEITLKSFSGTASAADKKKIEANLLRCAQNAERLHRLVTEWKARLAAWK